MSAMSGVELAVAAAMGYFVVFGFGFLVRPELADRFGLRWVRPAGRTEVRCYYGAVSWGLAGFLGYLWNRGLEVEALTGVLILAGAVLATRVVGTVVDGAGDDPYTRVALPTETAFVVALALVLATA
jgi:hypothetical protein